MHVILSIPIVGFVYGPVSQLPVSSMIVRWIIFPIVVVSGFWMWKGHVVKKWFRPGKNYKPMIRRSGGWD